MAEEVEIGNVGGSGGVASEVTLQKLVTAMNALARQQGVKTDQLQKAQDAYARSLQKSTREIEDNTDALDDHTDAVRSNAGVFSKMGAVMVSALKGAANSAYGLSKELVTGGDELSDFTQHIPLVGGAFTRVIQVLEGARDNFRGLSEVGAGFNNSIVEITKQAGLSGLTLGKFNELVLNSSDSMMFFGGTVSGGAREFTQLARDMRTGGIGSNLLSLGFTVADLNEGLITTTALEARVTGQRIRDEQALIGTSQEYLKEIDKLAKLTGISRKQAQQEMLQNAQEANVARMLADLDADGRRNFQANMGFVSANMGQYAGAFKDLADGLPQTELGIAMKALVPEFAELAEASATGRISQAEFIERIQNEVGPKLTKFAGTFDAAATTALMGDNTLGGVFSGLFQVKEVMAKVFDPKAAEEEQKRREAITTALQQFETTIGEIRAKVFTAFFAEPDGIGTRLQNFLESVKQEDINRFNKNINDFIDKLTGADPLSAFDGMFTTIKNTFLDIMFGELKTIGPDIQERQGGLFKTLKDAFMDSMFGELQEDGKRAGGLFETIKTSIVDGFKSIMENPALVKALEDGFRSVLTTLNESSFIMDMLIDDDKLKAPKTKEEKFTDAQNTLDSMIAGYIENKAQMDAGIPGAAYGMPGSEENLRRAIDAFVNQGGDLSTVTLPEGFTRQIGTLKAIGRSLEPRNTIANIHAGERVLNAQEAASYNSTQAGQKGTVEALNQLNSTMNQATGLLNEIRLLSKKQVTGIQGMGYAIQ